MGAELPEPHVRRLQSDSALETRGLGLLILHKTQLENQQEADASTPSMQVAGGQNFSGALGGTGSEPQVPPHSSGRPWHWQSFGCLCRMTCS